MWLLEEALGVTPCGNSQSGQQAIQFSSNHLKPLEDILRTLL
jgi:hypothetical protein